MKLEPLIQLETVVTATWRRLVVHVFEGKLTVDDMARLDRAGTEWMKKEPGRVAELVIVHPSNARMTGEERSAMAALIKKRESTRAASATVVLATGLVGAMHRSVLTGLQLIAPSPHPMKVFGATAEAVAWLSPHVQSVCGAEATSAAVLAAVDELCRSFRANHTR
jgi:hypothetical protein